jgi:gas vesicle protein
MAFQPEGETMNNLDQDQLVGFFAGLLLGTLIGATAAVLTAPQSGRKTRKRIGKVATGTRKRLGKTAVEIRKSTGDRWDELADEVKERVDDAMSGARKRFGSG